MKASDKYRMYALHPENGTDLPTHQEWLNEIVDLRDQLAAVQKLQWVQNYALKITRDYLMWLVEFNGIKMGAIDTVRGTVSAAIDAARAAGKGDVDGLR